MINGVVFDLEGTLVKLPIDYEALYKEIRRELKISRVKPLTQTVKTLDNKSKWTVYKLWERAELKALPNMDLNERGMKLYKKHSSKPVALVTMQGVNVVRKIVNHFHLAFDVIVTREIEIDRSQQIKKAVNEMSLTPSDVLVIGDRESDEAAARKVGCEFAKV